MHFKKFKPQISTSFPFFCNFGRYTELVLRMYSHIRNLKGMYSLKKHISTLSFYLLLLSTSDVYAFMVVTVEKGGKLQLGYRVLLSFVIAQRFHIFRFKKKPDRTAPPSGYWYRYHLYWMIRPVSRATNARITKWKILAAGIEPTISGLLDWRSSRVYNRVVLTVDIYR